jgi:hypothetical protein
MKPNGGSSLAHTASVAIFGAFFAASQGSAVASRNAGHTFARAAHGTTEHLIGTATLMKVCHGSKNGGWSTDFSASGTAMGLYPGTFTAAGGWGAGGLPAPSWSISGNYTIVAGPTTIDGTFIALGSGPGAPGTCTVVKRFTVAYMSAVGSGYAQITIRAGRFHMNLLKF